MTWQRKPLRGMEPQTFVTKPEGIKRTPDLGDQWWVLRTSCTHCNVLYWGRLTRHLCSEDWNLFSVRGEMIITAQDDTQYKQYPGKQRVAGANGVTGVSSGPLRSCATLRASKAALEE